jgi:hypothetical protein
MASTYTFTQKTIPAEPNQEENFNNQVNDGAHNAMGYGSGFQTTDATGTPVASPATISNSSVTTINVPASAVQFNMIATTNTVNVSEADATVASKYFTIPTGVQVEVDVAKTSVLYLKANTGSATLSFWFNVV